MGGSDEEATTQPPQQAQADANKGRHATEAEVSASQEEAQEVAPDVSGAEIVDDFAEDLAKLADEGGGPHAEE